MNAVSLALCDADETYCRRLYEYLKNNLKLSFDIFSFTKIRDLQSFAENSRINLLVISESLSYELSDLVRRRLFKNILILDEGISDHSFLAEEGCDGDGKVKHISKFQSATGIMGALIDFCTDTPDSFNYISTRVKLGKSKILGFYTPLTRCGQTTMAIKTAELLSKEGRDVFLSFESFSSLPGMLGVEPGQDITDLFYYAECERSKLGLYMEKIKKTVGGVDYIMPAKTADQVRDLGNAKIKELLEILTSEMGYDFVILDMTEYPEGFMDILSMCHKVITITGESDLDAIRLRAYDTVLRENDLGEIESKTVKCRLQGAGQKRIFDGAVRELLLKEGLLDGNKA